MTTNETQHDLVNQLATRLLRQQKKLAVAESCTGGGLAKVLTDLPGSSEWFERGFVTYSNQSKHEMLDVKESTLKQYGAVSEETVIEMAQGVLKNSHADFSVSISGIAGPGGGTKNKPVGLVWFAFANQDKRITSQQRLFEGDRNAVREQAIHYALTNLLQFIQQ